MWYLQAASGQGLGIPTLALGVPGIEKLALDTAAPVLIQQEMDQQLPKSHHRCDAVIDSQG